MSMTLKISVVFIVAALCGACADSKERDDQADDSDKTPESGDGTESPDGEGGDLIIGDGEGVASKAGKFVAKLEWLSGPKAEDYVKARLTFATAARTAPSTVAEIVFDPQMPSMGHGTVTEDQTITPESPSVYAFIVDGIYFIMGGPWEIQVTAKVDGVVDTVAIEVNVP